MLSPNPSFHRFTELPLELRLQIWHLAAAQAGSTGPQVLPLLLVYEPHWEPPRSYIHIPRRWRSLYLQPRLRARLALLHSCREARAELLQPPSSSPPTPSSSPVPLPSSPPSPLSSSADPSSRSSSSSPPTTTRTPSRPKYQLARAPQLGLSTLQSPAAVWRAFLADPATVMARPGSVPYYDDSGAGAGASPGVFSTPDHWMRRVVVHFGPRLRGLWFMSRPVWREAEPALLRAPGRGHHRGGGDRGGRDDGDNGDGAVTSQADGVDPWDVLVREDREVSRDLVASGQVRLGDLPPQLGLTTEAINGWSTPVRVGTITGATSKT